MKSISKFLYVIIILLGSSCAERQPIKESENLIFVDLEKENSVSMYDLFSKVELIPLENTNEAVVGEPIREMRVDNGHFKLCRTRRTGDDTSSLYHRRNRKRYRILIR